VKVDLEVLDSIKHIPTECFRTYDIRGPVSATSINANLAYAIGFVLGEKARELELSEMIVGRDGRLTGPQISGALINGLRDAGINVTFIGEVPTPVVYFATSTLPIRSGVMVTASHNPKDHNGFKIVLNGKTLDTAGIQDILQRIQNLTPCEKQITRGTYKEISITDEYIDFIAAQIKLKRRLKVVIDCGNGAGAITAPKLFSKLNCDVIEMFCTVDGNFPNHHPDPSVPENVQDIIAKVLETKADVGLAFDGDADRIGVISNKGEVIWPDRQMMLLSEAMLKEKPGSEIVFDVKCSRYLPEIIKKSGGRPVMWRTGHSVLKAKLLELGAPLAGEMSGHIFYNDERWFGFDDGVYVGARILEILANDSRSVSEIFDALPNGFSTPELKLPMPEERKEAFMQKLAEQADFGDVEIITLDGLRVEFKDGWGLIRPSNTSPYLILRFEEDSEGGLERIKELFRRELLKIDADLELPF